MTDDRAPDAAPRTASTESEHRHAHAAPRLLPGWVAIALAVLAGGFTAVQSRINGQLAARLDDAYTAAAISFGSGLAILLAVLVFWRPGRVGFAKAFEQLRAGRISWWMLLGGLAGAWFVVTQGLSAGVIGVALFTVSIVAGQTVGGVVFDLVGLGPAGRRPITVARAIGAVIALGAVLWTVSAELGGDAPIVLILLPFTAGLGAAWQQAVNGRVRAAASSALTSTVVNFAVGTTVLVAVMLLHAASAGWPASLPTEPWLYAGGAIGCVFIAVQAVVVRVIGVLVLALGGVAGQLTAALALDLIWPIGDATVDLATIAGTLLALVAVVIASVRWRGSRHAARPEADEVSPTS
ncbi:transporter family-2 protein [Agromyces terreus]|uniref:Transporter family-2 protein n=1 Tax=Agromyces terreus TaxID=424795 RepID=A0A9X2KAQ8_9MICO|nr:DMT family transporter [Agromyces terreus]MCP2369340.1 transporter family-2 protein [Agromyces terreus]